MLHEGFSKCRDDFDELSELIQANHDNLKHEIDDHETRLIGMENAISELEN